MVVLKLYYWLNFEAWARDEKPENEQGASLLRLRSPSRRLGRQHDPAIRLYGPPCERGPVARPGDMPLRSPHVSTRPFGALTVVPGTSEFQKGCKKGEARTYGMKNGAGGGSGGWNPFHPFRSVPNPFRSVPFQAGTERERNGPILKTRGTERNGTGGC